MLIGLISILPKKQHETRGFLIFSGSIEIWSFLKNYKIAQKLYKLFRNKETRDEVLKK